MKRAGERRGFALIITVSLLALLVLVLLALASLTRVETSVAGNTRKFSQARQNALLALNVAIGRLQEAAGPDQRVTATAEITGVTNANKHWTGVWNSNGGARIAWLVSGNETVVVDDAKEKRPGVWSPTSSHVSPTGGDDGAVLVEANTAGTDVLQHVVAPLVDIAIPEGTVPGFDPTSTASIRVGRYAWWVGDEGVKARVNLVDPYNESTNAFEQEVRLTAAQRVGIERVNRTGSTQLGASYPANDPSLTKVLTLNQLPFTSSPSAGNLLTAIRNRFHDLTASSVGLLTNVANGGLKLDLNRVLDSETVAYPDGHEVASGVRPLGTNYYPPHWGNLRAYSKRIASGASFPPSVDQGYQRGIHPYVTAISIWYGAASGSGSLFESASTFSVVVANPYDVSISTATYDLKVDFTGTLTLTQAVEPFAPFLAASTPSTLTFRMQNVSFDPGQVRYFTLPTGAHDPSSPISLTEVIPSVLGYIRGATLIGAHLNDVFTAKLGEGEISLELKSGGSQLQYARRIAIHDDPPWSGSLAVLGGDSARVTGRTVHLRAAAGSAGAVGEDGLGIPTRWIADYSIGATVSQRPEDDGAASLGQNPLWDVKRLFVNATTNPEVTGPYWGPTFLAPPAENGRTSVVLFHVIRGELISIGELQHVGLQSLGAEANGGAQNRGNTPQHVGLPSPGAEYLAPTYVIGNSYIPPYVAPPEGDSDPKDVSFAMNEALWDDFFCSGFVGNSFPNPLPNPRLKTYVPPGGSLPSTISYDRLTASLVVHGAFNVNSTSVDAWAAVLASMNGIQDPTGTLSDSGVDHPLENPFFRSSQPVADAAVASNASVGSELASPPARGVRRLSDAVVHELAAQIAAEVKARGPFLSLAAFVNRDRLSSDSTKNSSGALQTALDRTPGVQPDEWVDAGGIGANLTGWISQADVLTALGPILAARSDTFLIRAYGETVNPLILNADGSVPANAIEGRAWCEAVVQRVPDYVEYSVDSAGKLTRGDNPWERDDPTTAVEELTPINKLLGRRFVIVSFRWLTPADI